LPVLESQEQVDKAIGALKDYQAAVKASQRAAAVASDKLGALKSLTGITGNDAKVIEEQVLMMLGHVQLHGLPERRGG
jgi:hypothetical protein